MVKVGLVNVCHHTLQGRLIVNAGSERFQSEMGPWSFLGGKALGADPYIPDFDAKVYDGLRSKNCFSCCRPPLC